MSDKKLFTAVLTLREYCRGLLADQKVNHAEATALRDRFKDLPLVTNVPALAQVKQTLLAALEDFQISDQESDELVACLGEFCDADIDALVSSAQPPTPASTGAGYLGRVLMGVRYLITYTGSDGKTGEREIIPRQVRQKEDGIHYLACTCLKASAPRTLRADRIGSMVNSETGEVVL